MESQDLDLTKINEALAQESEVKIPQLYYDLNIL